MKLNPKRDIRDLARFNQIMLILTKQGFGHIFSKISPTKLFTKKQVNEGPVRLRKTLEKLGATFIKFGQILSLRPDLIPIDYIKELGKLQDDVPPFSSKKAKEIIEEELKVPIEGLFKTFSEEPIASASISQVHKATLKDDTKVAVKVQRPNVEEIMKTDIEIMFYVAKILEKRSKTIRKYHPIGIVREFKKWSNQELNFKIEAKNAKKFYENFKNSKTVVIPKIYDEYCSRRVLTSEFLDGVELHTLYKVKRKKGYNINKIIKNGFDAIMTQVFVHGFFHADPHPGNILILKGNKIGLVDFGIVGHFNKKLKKKSIELFYGIIDEDMDSILDTFLDMGLVNERETNIQEFKDDVLNSVEPLQTSALKDVQVSAVLEDVLDLALKHHVKLPLDFVLFGKAILEIEGVGLEYAPNFKFVDTSRPFIEKLIKKDIKLTNMAKNLTKNLLKYRKFIKDLPDQISSALRRIQKGTLKIDVEDTDIRKLGKDIDSSSNRLTYGMIIAAFIVAGALLAQTGTPLVYGYPLLSVMCFVLACIFLVMLFSSIKSEPK